MFANSIKRKTKLLAQIMQQNPRARAIIHGDQEHSGLYGTVEFYTVSGGVLVVAEVFGLPTKSGACATNIYGFHIHEGNACTGNAEDPFAASGGHYNPNNCPHPQHAGDMPPLFGNNGYAWSSFFTQRFNVDEIIGRTVIIHAAPDNFTTQPSGNSGAKIACGVIERV